MVYLHRFAYNIEMNMYIYAHPYIYIYLYTPTPVYMKKIPNFNTLLSILSTAAMLSDAQGSCRSIGAGGGRLGGGVDHGQQHHLKSDRGEKEHDVRGCEVRSQVGGVILVEQCVWVWVVKECMSSAITGGYAM